MNRSSFFNRQKVAVTALLSEQSVSDFIVQIRASEFDGADAFAAELKHLPLEERTEEHFKAMINATQLPAMFLSYRNDKFLGADDEARQKYLLLAAQCGAEVIDVMGDLYDPSEFELTRDAVAIKKQMKLIDEIHSIGSKVIMSSHMPVFRTKDEVLEHMLRQSERGADICKLVQGVNTPQELALAVETTMYLNEKLDKPFVHLCGGKYARPHRFMSAALGNSIVFAIHEYRAHQILGGQPPIRNYRAVIDNFGWSRKKSVVINCAFILLASLPCVLGYNVWSDFRPLLGKDVLDTEDFIVSNLLLPGGSLVYLLFCVSKWGWGYDKYMAEANTGAGMKLPVQGGAGKALKVYLQFLLPVIILVILVVGMPSLVWKIGACAVTALLVFIMARRK